MMTLDLKLENLSTQLRDITQQALNKEVQRLALFSQIAESRSPEHILKLGFAVARVAGRAITSRSQVASGDTVTIEVADGTITTKIIE
jgi:exonuclease VII large subunit